MGYSRSLDRAWCIVLFWFYIALSFSGCGGSSGGGGGNDPVEEAQLSVGITSPSGNITLNQGESIDFQATVSGGTSPYTYTWDFGGGAGNKYVEDPGLITFNEAGSFTVKLIVADKENASASSSLVVTVKESPPATDTTPPTISSSSPAPGAAGVVTGTVVSITFSENMDPASITESTFTLSSGTALIPGTVACSGATATFTPSSALAAGTSYTARVTTGVKDSAGNALASEYAWSFVTSTSTTPPSGDTLSIISRVPSQGATGVAVNTLVHATFNTAINAATVTPATFLVTRTADGEPVDGMVSGSGSTATFEPDSNLLYGTQYTVRITRGVKDLSGNSLGSDSTWSFTTAHGNIPELLMQFLGDPTQQNYDVLMSAIDAAGDTKEAKLYKAMGELLDIYNSPKTRQIIADAGLPAIGFDTDFESLEYQYNINSIVDSYFKQSPSLYDTDSQALFFETEERLTRVDALLAEADGIDVNISYGPLYTVRIDSIDIKLLRAMVNLVKAYFVYLQSLNLTITDYSVVYENVTYDIRDLYTNKPETDDYGAMLDSAWMQVLNNNPSLLTYKDRSASSKLAQFRSTLQMAFDFYGSAVMDIAALTDEQKRDRYNNAFSLDGDATMALAQLVHDQGMVSAMACMNGTAEQLTFPRPVMTRSEYVDASPDDDLYYLKETYNIYLDTFCPDITASEITAFRLFGSGTGADKTPRDLILEVTALPVDSEYYPYVLCGAPALYLSGVSDIIWQDFMDTYLIPTATINIDGLSGDWDGVDVFYAIGTCTYKIARDAGNNVYLSIESTHVPSALYWSSTFGMLMEYGGDDLDDQGHEGFSINCNIYGSSTLTAGCSIWDWANGTTMPAGTCAIFTDNTVGVEMRAPVLSDLLKQGSSNYFWIMETNVVPWYGQDKKLLPEFP